MTLPKGSEAETRNKTGVLCMFVKVCPVQRHLAEESKI